MCPYFTLNQEEKLCAASLGRGFVPGNRRREKHCQGSFTRCVFYQLKTKNYEGIQDGVGIEPSGMLASGKN